MARSLPATDVVIVGLGWTGSIMAYELAKAGLAVVAIERGPWRDTATGFPSTYAADELRYAVRKELFLQPAQTTFTFRNNPDQTALPIRAWSSFLPPDGVGGGGVHWNAETWRFLESDFVLHSHLEERYGTAFLPPDMAIQNWGVTYADLEPHYDRFEYLCGTSGKAGNIGGKKQEGGNPFEGPRKREYPNPPQAQPYGPTWFAKVAAEMGYHPFPQPSGNLSRAYTNPLGVTLGPCTYCGFCEGFGCGNFAKASPQTTILPALLRQPHFGVRPQCEVTRVNLDRGGRRAIGVTYVDASGTEFEQPAEIVILSAFQLFNVQLMLLSGVGKPYDPSTGEGVVGRNYSYQVTSTVNGFWEDRAFNPFVASGAIGMLIDDFNGDNFDHASLGFVGGGYMGASWTGSRPIEGRVLPKGSPQWGAEWKRLTREHYQSTYQFQTHGSFYSYRTNYLDLDPTYKDRFGRPLMRITMDFHDNERRMSAFLTDKLAGIVRQMDPKRVEPMPRDGHYTMGPYQTTHPCGGAIMGSDPSNSVLNRYLQSWDVPNLFVTGAAAFPQNAGYNPTGTVGALAYWSAQAIVEKYLNVPGPLVHR